MVRLNKNINKVQLSTGFLPAILSTVFLINKSWIFLLLCVLSLFIIIGLVPVFRKRESLYMFLLVALAGVPVNIVLCYLLICDGFFSSDLLIADILWGILLYSVLFSTEEVIFGVITRLIWKRQYKLKIQ